MGTDPMFRALAGLVVTLAAVVVAAIFITGVFAPNHTGSLHVGKTSFLWGKFLRHPILWAGVMLLVPALALCLWLDRSAVEGLFASNRPTAPTGNQQLVKVWVRTKAGLYNCPGTTWYGKLKPGKYMAQGEALQAGFQPVLGELCPCPVRSPRALQSRPRTKVAFTPTKAHVKPQEQPHRT